MIVVAKPNLTRACQFARSGDCASLEDIQTRMAHEGLDPTIVKESVEMKRMLRGLIRQAAPSTGRANAAQAPRGKGRS